VRILPAIKPELRHERHFIIDDRSRLHALRNVEA
jgi:hypothetical protein